MLRTSMGVGQGWLNCRSRFWIGVLAACASGCSASKHDEAEVLPTSSTEGTLDYRVAFIYYAPPGAGSMDRYKLSELSAPSEEWQMPDANGNPVTVDVTLTPEPMPAGPVVATTTINVQSNSDVPSGLFDSFFVVMGIPGTLDIFPAGHPERLTLDYRNAASAILNGAQLLALAESAPNAQTLLQNSVQLGEAQIDAVNQYITADAARAILLLDPNFMELAPGGPLAVRNSLQLSRRIESNTDRFQPVNDGEQNPSTPALRNTLPVPAAPAPGNPNPALSSGYQPGDMGAAAYGTGAELNQPLAITAPGFGTTFQEQYLRTTIDTIPSVSFEMGSPCVAGMVDLYYDAAFGTYLYVSHDIAFVPRPVSGNAEWYSRCTGTLLNFDGTACDTATDCASQLCENGVCAPPACSPNCEIGEACGMDGECGGFPCTYGVCTGE